MESVEGMENVPVDALLARWSMLFDRALLMKLVPNLKDDPEASIGDLINLLVFDTASLYESIEAKLSGSPSGALFDMMNTHQLLIGKHSGGDPVYGSSGPDPDVLMFGFIVEEAVTIAKGRIATPETAGIAAFTALLESMQKLRLASVASALGDAQVERRDIANALGIKPNHLASWSDARIPSWRNLIRKVRSRAK
ncbi:hypothetical protein ACS7JX_19335 [Rhodococcus erythropolis]